MNVVLAKTGAAQAVSNVFVVARDRLPGDGAVAEARSTAFAKYEQRGLPHRRLEEWKYTDLRVLMKDVLPLAPAPDQAALKQAAAAVKTHSVEGATRLTLVDGVFVAELSELNSLGVTVTPLREALSKSGGVDFLTNEGSNAMLSLNAAMATDGAVIAVANGVHAAKPIQILHIATVSSAAAFTRSRLTLGDKASATLVETFVAADGTSAYQAHDATIIRVGDEADLSHVRMMADAPDAANITNAEFTVGAKARLNFFNMTSGGRVSRYQGIITLAGEGSDVSINGVNLLKNTQHGDMTLVVDHAVPNCASREIFRAVLDDRAHSVFQGRIIVRPQAQKTDGKMMTRALLLSDDAEADNKPELEIFADDVTCGHGATTGALDESLLFYLRARGLPEKDAEALLVQAFVGEAIETIGNEALRERAIDQAARWLAARK